jgi:hypothetical protein
MFTLTGASPLADAKKGGDIMMKMMMIVVDDDECLFPPSP